MSILLIKKDIKQNLVGVQEKLNLNSDKMWRAEIIAEINCLKIIHEKFPKFVINEEDKYYLTCPQFQDLNNNDLTTFAKLTLQNILDFVNLQFGETFEGKIGSYENIKENGTKDVILTPEPISIKFKMGIPSITVTNKDGKINESEENYESYLPCILKNQQIQRALHFNRNPNWINLYKIYEIIEDDVGNKSIIENKNWAKAGEIDLFRCTAHTVQGAGDEARHAVTGKINDHCKKVLSSNEPMEISYAKTFVKNILIKWIDFKC